MSVELTESYKLGLKHSIDFRVIDGWLSDVEGFILYQYARSCTLGEIVEIGAFKGKSTCWLASALRDNMSGLNIYSIDWHKGSPDFKLGQTYTSGGVWTGSSLEEFKANLEKHKLSAYVSPMIMKSEEALKDWRKPVGLLFIDGDHSYEACRFDFMNWTRFIPVGGTVIMHDATTWPGPKAVVNEFINGNDKWNWFSVDSIVVATKIK